MTERDRCPRCDSASCDNFARCGPVPHGKWGVHISHCCRTHGCKYGESDCPVEQGKVKQEFPCEDCEPTPKIGWDDGIPNMLRVIAFLIDTAAHDTESALIPLPQLDEVMKHLEGRGNPAIVKKILAALA